jgi:hypothetical protein
LRFTCALPPVQPSESSGAKSPWFFNFWWTVGRIRCSAGRRQGHFDAASSRSTGGQSMPLRRMIVALALSFLLSQQLLTQTPSQAPNSGSSATQTSGTPNNRPAKPGCTDNGSYVNSKGQTVKRPENCTTTPQGATAQCGDGTYSFSKSRRGTCSHHGGVAKWL